MKRDHAIGVILSGMGSDGTPGLRAIKKKAGLVMTFSNTTSDKRIESGLRVENDKLSHRLREGESS